MPTRNAVLYYPWIEFHNLAWVKSSLLLWDNIYRIVPKSYTPKDDDDIRACIDKDIIRDISLERQDLSAVSNSFLRFIDRLPFRPAGLEGIDLSRLHREKIDDRLYPYIEKIAGEHDSEGFYQVHSDLARGYMFYLAKTVSGRRNLAMATDNRDAWAIMPYFTESANFDEQVWNPEAEGFYTSLVFTDILPANIENVGIGEIINFIEKRKDEREQLRMTISEFAQQLSRCTSMDHIKTIQADFQKKILTAKNEFKKSSGLISEDFGHSLLVVGLPLGLSTYSALGMVNDPYDPMTIFPSVLIGAIAAYQDYQRARLRDRNNSPYSFLIDIDEYLIQKRAIPLYWRSFEEFMND